jgi:hypothetical protein
MATVMIFGAKTKNSATGNWTRVPWVTVRNTLYYTIADYWIFSTSLLFCSMLRNNQYSSSANEIQIINPFLILLTWTYTIRLILITPNNNIFKHSLASFHNQFKQLYKIDYECGTFRDNQYTNHQGELGTQYQLFEDYLGTVWLAPEYPLY